MSLVKLTATEISQKLRQKQLGAVEVAEAFLKQIDEQNPRLNALIHHNPERALKQAEAAQKRIDCGEGGALTGVPVIVKDNIAQAGERLTCASRMLENYVSPFDAHVVERLDAAGSVIVGKANLDEFAMGASNEYSYFGPVRNPWDTERAPGGSSGGSASAVAAHMAPFSLGSDTGGSVRQPASLCGLVGMKPTYGRVSRYGLVAFASSLDQIGPFAKSVQDLKLILDEIMDFDERDSTSLPGAKLGLVDFDRASLKGLRCALPEEFFGEGVEPGVIEATNKAVEALRDAGAVVENVHVPMIARGVVTYYIIAPAEASSNLARFDGVRYGFREDAENVTEMMKKTRDLGFGHEVKQRILIGTYALSAGYYDAYYLKAQKARALMAQQLQDVLDDYDVIIGPTSPNVAFPLGSLSDDPLALKMLDRCTIPANLSGKPAISIPCGSSEGFPAGLQFLGKAMEDERLLEICFAAERALDGLAPKLPGAT